MAEFPALPLWTDAYLADCSHLGDGEHGRYLMMLILLWRAPKQRFPNDDAWLARKFNRSLEVFVSEWKPLMQEFMQNDGNWWTQKRLTQQFAYTQSLSAKRRDAAKSRWDKEKGTCTSNAPISISISPSTELVSKSRDSSDGPVGPPSKKTAPARGTRWPPDAVIPQDWIDEAGDKRRALKLAPTDLAVQAEMFTNFWSSKTGKDATKLDWKRTWMNWILKAEGTRHVGNGKLPSPNDKFLAGAAKLMEKFDAESRTGEGKNPNDALGEAGRPLLPR